MNVNIYHKHKDIIITTFIIASRAYLQQKLPRRPPELSCQAKIVLSVIEVFPSDTKVASSGTSCLDCLRSWVEVVSSASWGTKVASPGKSCLVGFEVALPDKSCLASL